MSGFVCSGSQKDKQNTFKVKQIQGRSLTNYLLHLKDTLGKNRKKLNFKMCACTILKQKTFSPEGLAQRSPEGPSLKGEPLKAIKVTQCEISSLERNKSLDWNTSNRKK